MSITLTLPDKRYRLVHDERIGLDFFYEYSQAHPELIMELDTDGTIIVISPVTLKSGKAEGIFITYINIWAIEHGMGEVFSSSTGFTLPDGSVRSPDAAWVSDEKMEKLPAEERNRFAALVPDFIVEVRSKTDRLKVLQAKMQETWIDNGVRLGWLVDLENEQVYVYRADGSIEVIKSFDESVSGEHILSGFSFDLRRLLA